MARDAPMSLLTQQLVPPERYEEADIATDNRDIRQVTDADVEQIDKSRRPTQTIVLGIYFS